MAGASLAEHFETTFAEKLVDRIRAFPGVQAVGYAGALPMIQTLGSVFLMTSPDDGSNAAPVASFDVRLPADRPAPRYVSREFLRVCGRLMSDGRSASGSNQR